MNSKAFQLLIFLLEKLCFRQKKNVQTEFCVRQSGHSYYFSFQQMMFVVNFPLCAYLTRLTGGFFLIEMGSWDYKLASQSTCTNSATRSWRSFVLGIVTFLGFKCSSIIICTQYPQLVPARTGGKTDTFLTDRQSITGLTHIVTVTHIHTNRQFRLST